MKKIILGIGSVVLLVLDLWSKTWIASNLAVGERIAVIPNFFYITFLKNTGSAWSMFEGMGWLVILIGIGVAGVIIYYYIKSNSTLLLIALALAFAGNIGNMVDRYSLGYVRDMISFNLFGYWFPVFNVADMCLVCGVLLVFLHTYLEEKKEHTL